MKSSDLNSISVTQLAITLVTRYISACVTYYEELKIRNITEKPSHTCLQLSSMHQPLFYSSTDTHAVFFHPSLERVFPFIKALKVNLHHYNM